MNLEWVRPCLGDRTCCDEVRFTTPVFRSATEVQDIQVHTRRIRDLDVVNEYQCMEHRGAQYLSAHSTVRTPDDMPAKTLTCNAPVGSNYEIVVRLSQPQASS